MINLTKKPNERQSTYEAKLRTLKVYEHHWHNISTVCEMAGISRDTFYEWQKNDSEFREVLVLIQQMALGFVEDMLMELIEKHDFAAIKFYLSHRHPDYMLNRPHTDEVV